MKIWQHLASICLLMLGSGGSLAADAQPPDRTLSGDKVCTRCHDENEAKPVLSIYQTRHGVKADARTPGCQSCHGASEAHAKNPGSSEIRPPVDISYGAKSRLGMQAQNQACLDCHQTAKRMQWGGSAHDNQDVGCIGCHRVHVAQDPARGKQTEAGVCANCHKEQRAQLNYRSHHPIVEGKMACSDCHSVHGSMAPMLMNRPTANDTCYTCHTEKRGPFLFEHPPVSEDCMSCHYAHGSPQEALLKQRPPYLCQQCHMNNGHPSTAYSGLDVPSNQRVGAKGCMNCHSQIHGSNHPSGGRRQR